jgi:hypothetical protein
MARNQPIQPEPYCILQRYDFASFEAVSNYRTLKGPLNSNYITLPNKNQVFKIVGTTPLNYNLWVSCNSPIRFLSVSSYLAEYQGFSSKAVALEYGDSEADKMTVLGRLRIAGQAPSRVVVRLRMPELGLARYMRYRLIEQAAAVDFSHEGVNHNPA